jgi:poly(3-hydroxybutyrate) depolymerase
MMKKLLLIGMAFLTTSLLHAQQTGNIVAYFGQEKVESTAEGRVIKQFAEGYRLRDAFPGGVLFSGRDIIAWQIATECFVSPKINPNPAANYPDHEIPLRWELVTADSTGRFVEGMRGAYLYTEFESPEEMTVLLDATGHTRVFVNGFPHEGDHYDYGYTLIPLKLRKGVNDFIYTPGRFGRVTSKLVLPKKAVMFSTRDMTLPGIISGEGDEKWAAVRVINTSDRDIAGLIIECMLQSGEKTVSITDNIVSMTTRKLQFRVPAPGSLAQADTIQAILLLRQKSGSILDTAIITLKYQHPDRHHERTFISNIDGSVQYYSVAPSLSDGPGQAFVLSVHGASVEATNQTRAYKQKDWAHIVAPTNRRPFGFNWEEWGRIDALEVMIDALNIFDTDPAQRYLTGHSMGGHGAWFLGATYPDKFAAIAPCAGYPDIIGYRRGASDSSFFKNPHYEMIQRGASAGRVLNLSRNYRQSGVYVLHGDADKVVPVEQARQMRTVLGEFHPNFAYYEYPDGSHWYGNHSMDWPPLFDFLRQNKTPILSEINHIEFYTASPAVSSSNYWIAINRQQKHYHLSKADFKKTGDTIRGTIENVENITFFLSQLDFEENPLLIINEEAFNLNAANDITLEKIDNQWAEVTDSNFNSKYPGRYGGFKPAFDNRMLFVFATGGNETENEWYKNKARFDAETFLYRGNGSVDIIPDTLFWLEGFPDRNVIIYGNAENNSAWNLLLVSAPVTVRNGQITFGEKTITGEDLGAFFLYPRTDSDVAAVGVIAGSGETGMRAAFANDYFSGITGFPDLLIFKANMLNDGLTGLVISGFFGGDWSVEKGEFVIDTE